MGRGQYIPLQTRGVGGHRLPVTRRRIASATDLYMVGLEERLDELSNFQQWAVKKLAEQDKQIAALKKKDRTKEAATRLNTARIVDEDIVKKKTDCHT